MKIVECPRDAMQGIGRFIDTEQKVAYLNALLKVGFDTLDCGSFVSPQAIPQMRDTADVFSRLDISSSTKILAVVANVRGARNACLSPVVNYVGYPMSLSETFQRLNTRRSIDEAWVDLAEIQALCHQSGKELVVYISMAFGNPYGDPYHTDFVLQCVDRLHSRSVATISIADTVGVATLEDIRSVFQALPHAYPSIDFGAHLHSKPESVMEKIDAVYKAGCQRFEGTLGGWGGCPMANNPLVGNIPTEAILGYLSKIVPTSEWSIKQDALDQAKRLAQLVFSGEDSKNIS